MEAVSSIAGVIALSLQVYLLMRPHNRGLLLLLSGVMFLWAFHYWGLGSPAAAGFHIWAAVAMWTGIVANRYFKDARLVMAAAITIVNLVLGAVLYQQPADLIMLAGNISFALCHILLAGRALRWGYIGAESIVGVAAFSLGSLPGMAIAVLMALANARALSRWQRAQDPVVAAAG